MPHFFGGSLSTGVSSRPDGGTARIIAYWVQWRWWNVGEGVRYVCLDQAYRDSGVAMGWLGIRATRFTREFGKGWLRILATRFTTLPTCAFGARGNDGKPLAGNIDGLADLGAQGTGESAAHADMSPALGLKVVGLGKKDADEVVGGCADICSVQGAGVVGLGKR